MSPVRGGGVSPGTSSVSWDQHPACHPAPGVSQAPVMLNRILPSARIYFISTFAFANTYPPVPQSRGGVTGAGGKGGHGHCWAGAASPRAGKVSALPRFLPLIRALFGRGVPCAHRKEEGECGAGSGPGEGRKSCVCSPGDGGSRAAAGPSPSRTSDPQARAGSGIFAEMLREQSRGRGLILLPCWSGSPAMPGVPLGLPAPRDVCLRGAECSRTLSSLGDASNGVRG